MRTRKAIAKKALEEDMRNQRKRSLKTCRSETALSKQRTNIYYQGKIVMEGEMNCNYTAFAEFAKMTVNFDLFAVGKFRLICFADMYTIVREGEETCNSRAFVEFAKMIVNLYLFALLTCIQ